MAYGAELVGVAEHNTADQAFQGPAVLHELDGQIVQQLGVRRQVTLGSKLLTGRDQPAAKQFLPVTIDQDAGRQRREALAEGEVLFDEGDPGDSVFVIQSGEIELTRESGLGRRTVARLGAGEFFGEMSVVLGEPRTARAVAAPSSSDPGRR